MKQYIYKDWKNENDYEGTAELLEFDKDSLTFFCDNNVEEVESYNRWVRDTNLATGKENTKRKKLGLKRLPLKRFVQPDIFQGERWLVEFEDGFRAYRWIRVMVTSSNSLEKMSECTSYDDKSEDREN
jgi:hypothetical protein